VPARPLALLRALGPGLIAGAADNDPTTVATLAVLGATTVYRLSCLVLLLFPLLAAVQVTAARVGVVAGQGLPGVVRTTYGRTWGLLPVDQRPGRCRSTGTCPRSSARPTSARNTPIPRHRPDPPRPARAPPFGDAIPGPQILGGCPMVDHWLPIGEALLTLGVLVGLLRLHRRQRRHEREMRIKLATLARLLERTLQARTPRFDDRAQPLGGRARGPGRGQALGAP
jgi:hypothetical protein